MSFTGLLNPSGTFSIKWTTCASCGCVIAMESTHYDELVKSHRRFYCPNGHEQWFTGKSDAEKLRDELAREKHRTEQARADAEHQRSLKLAAERREAAKKGQITRIKNRVSSGVCPCCNRYFANLHRHMKGKHPDWNPESKTADIIVIPEAVGYWNTAKVTWNRLTSRRALDRTHHRRRGEEHRPEIGIASQLRGEQRPALDSHSLCRLPQRKDEAQRTCS